MHSDKYLSFAKYYKIVARLWYIQGLVKYLCTFIKHCPQCLILQTKKHWLYDCLQPIYSLLVLYYTIILDFILALLTFKKSYNVMISLANKYNKKLLLLPGKAIYTAADWAETLVD